MKRFPLAPHGPEVSALAYGVWRLDKDPEGTGTARVRAKIDACLESGITTFDHAAIYGNFTCEGHFGRALAEAPALRERMEIVTKCGIERKSEAFPNVQLPQYNASAAAIVQSVDRSLRELQTDYIDLLLIHRPDWLTSAEETAAGLSAVLASGKVRSVGVSNYSVHQFGLLARFLGTPPATNQVEINLFQIDAIHDGTLDQCQLLGIRPMAWSPLAGGRLFTSDDPNAVKTREVLHTIASEYGASPDQIALAWVAALPCGPQLVLGTHQIERIRRAADAVHLTLAREHWYALWSAAQGRNIP
jgi:predicted oxidoreductase